MYYIKNAKLVLETGILWDGVLAVDDGLIAAYGDASQMKIPAGEETLDAKGLYVGPGFVDIHVHGGNGHFFYEDPEKTAEHFLRHGETTVLATFYHDLSRESFLTGIQKVKHAMSNGKAGKAIRGFYMEGPYMNPKYGAQAEKNQWLGPICPEDYEQIVKEAGSLARVWAVAPEREGVEDFISYVKKENPQATFAVGHSEAAPDQIYRLKKYGLSLQTHCMDATGQTTEWPGTRGCGPDEACLPDPDFYEELICDSQGIHVNPVLIRLLLKIKGVDKIILITDSFIDTNPAPANAKNITDLVFDANGGLCGSKLTMEVACKNMMTHTNCGIAQVFLMASRNPARVIGLDDEIGTIAVGKKANLVFVDDTFSVKKVILEGQICT